MHRRLLVLAGGAVLASPLCAFAQTAGKSWRIGMLETTSAMQNAANFDAFRQAMREFGYVEGRNLAIEYRSAEGRVDRFPALASELARLNVDLILARGTPAVFAAKKALPKTPIVMVSIGDPLIFAASLARPGGNVTGLSNQTGDFEGKRIELLQELVPGLTRFAVLYNMANPLYPRRWKALEGLAQSLGLHAQLLDARTAEDLPRVFESASRERAKGVLVSADGLFHSNRKLVAELAAKHGLPTIGQTREIVEAGGLIAFGPSYRDIYRRAGSYVDKIFKGANPGDLPIEQPTKVELVINLEAARKLGLTVPMSLLMRSDEVIQ